MKSEDLPSYTFVSSDAIQWALKSFKLNNETQAEILFQSLLNNNFIRHASGEKNKLFKSGFFLYCIMDETNNFDKHQIDLRAFERNWMEVGVVYQHNSKYLDNFYDDSNELMSHNNKFENSGNVNLRFICL